MEENKINVAITTQELEIKYLQQGASFSKNDMQYALIRVLNSMIDESNYKYHRERFDLGLYYLNNIEEFDCDTLARLLNTYGTYSIKKVAIIPLKEED